MALVEVKVPDIGDFDEVGVIEVLVKVGDTVKVEQSLITVESDKASMEIPSSQAGVVKEIKVAVGDKVKQGSVVVIVEVRALPPQLPRRLPLHRRLPLRLRLRHLHRPPLLPKPAAPSRSKCPTSATSTKWPSLNCW